MKKILCALAATLSLLPSVGCTHTEQGVAGGAIAGGAIGGLVTRSPVGAVAGAALGGVLGGTSGARRDDYERRVDAAVAADMQARARVMMTVDEVKQLTASRTPDHLIIGQIRTTGSRFELTARTLDELQLAGVSPTVIAEMQATAVRPVYQPAPYYGRPVYVVPGPPPPPTWGVGVVIR